MVGAKIQIIPFEQGYSTSDLIARLRDCSEMKALGILGSGKGTNCRAILERIYSGTLRATASIVISDVPEAPILEIAREFAVPNSYLAPGKFRTRLEPEVELELARTLQNVGVELVVLAGFMVRVLKSPMLDAFPRRIINIHPSLLPKFPGLEAWKTKRWPPEKKMTGCTVHYVDEKIDHGTIIAQRQYRSCLTTPRQACMIGFNSRNTISIRRPSPSYVAIKKIRIFRVFARASVIPASLRSRLLCWYNNA